MIPKSIKYFALPLLLGSLWLWGRPAPHEEPGAASTSYELRPFGKVLVTEKKLEGKTSTLVTLQAQSAQKAAMLASKLIADLKGFGDIRAVAGPATSLALKDSGHWVIGVDASKVQVLFSESPERLGKLAKKIKASTWEPVQEHSYPRWLDRFDNDSVSMGFLGFGAMPQDIDDEIAWMGERRLNIAGNCYYQQDCTPAPGVFDFTIPDYYAKLCSDRNLALVPYTNWGAPWRPTWIWNRVPLPHIIPEDGNFIAHKTLNEQKLAGYSEFEPVKATDGITNTAYRTQAEHFASLPSLNTQFGCPEIGHLITLSLSAIAGTPETKTAWHEYLQKKLGYDLAKAGTLYKGNPQAYTSWEDVELPTIKTFAGWNAGSCLDLRGTWDFKPGQINPQAPVAATPDNEGWAPLRTDDPIVLIHAGRHGDSANLNLGTWMRRNFEIGQGKAPHFKYLHLSRNNWHGEVSAPCDVYINGKKLKNISELHPTVFDYDLCYEVENTLTEGKNQILVNTHGTPIPGYIFLGSTGRWGYPSDNPWLNRQYFDVTEFAAHYRMQGIENTLRALRSGDPQGRPLQAMCPWDFVDISFDIFKKYGAYAHDTGQGGSCWAPWMARYYSTRGMPFSSEPGGPPSDPATMRQLITLWTLLGDDAVNLLFDPSQYRYRDKNSVGGWIENNAELLRCVGKMDMGKADVLVMRSIRDASRLRFISPWRMDVSRGDLQTVGRTVNLIDPSDLVSGTLPLESNVVFDAGSELLTEEEISGIERFVRNGGTFVAFERTGVHTPEKAYAWPISKLSGLEVVQNNGVKGAIQFTETETLWPSLQGKEIPVRGTVYDFTHTAMEGDGLAMEPSAKDVEVIARWANREPGKGDIAVAMRRLGKGKIITVGANFWRFAKDEGGRFVTEPDTHPYLDELLASLNIPAKSFRDPKMPLAGQLFLERWQSKNGLYDLYVAGRIGDIKGNPDKFTFGFDAPNPPSSLTELSAQQHPETPFQYADGRLTVRDIELLPMQLRIFAAPRSDLSRAPLVWLQSLAKRWPVLPEIPKSEIPSPSETDSTVLALNKDWTLCPGGERWGETPPAAFDWAQGRRVELGAFANLGLENNALAHFRKEFTVPPEWKGTRIKLSFAAVYWHWGIMPNGRLWVNGQPAPIAQPLTIRADGSFVFDLAPDANGKVVLELEIDGHLNPGERRPRPSGVTGVFFAQSDPQPIQSNPLNGAWQAFCDINTSTPVETGKKARYVYLEKRFTLPAKNAWPTSRPFLESPGHLGWLILNNHVVSTPGSMNRLNISGLLRHDGGENILRWVPVSMERPSVSRTIEGIVPELSIAWWPNNESPGKR